MSQAKLTLARLENLLMTACDALRGNMDASEYRGLQDLRRFLLAQGVPSVALPALGAGLGGLSWPAVRAEIEAALADLAVDIRVYEPLRAVSPT